jgi:hypothetical protein
VKARLLLLTLLAGGLLAMPAAASNSQSFPDSTGEDAQAPDITSVDVSNTDAGLITFKINISNRPALTPDMSILVWLDTDANPATGDPNELGADYVIENDPGAVGLLKWDGTTFSDAPSQTTLTYSYSATGDSITVGIQDLGGTKKINLGVDAISGIVVDAQGNPDFTNVHVDIAPDAGHGFYSYDVLTKVSLKQTAFTTTPKPAKAGAKFTASVAATESDTGGPVAKATITCVGTIKGVRLRAAHSLANGVASCFWKLPKTSKGKTLTGTISITVQGTTLTKRFTAKIT